MDWIFKTGTKIEISGQLLSEYFPDPFPPVIEDLLQPFPDERAEYLSEGSVWKCITYDIPHLHTAGNFMEQVAMVPEFIGTDALNVAEISKLFHISDLRDPGNRDPERRLDTVNNDLAGIDLRFRLREDPEIH
jgi:hypothetical protein